MWGLGTVRTDWSYEGYEYQKLHIANTIHTGVFLHNDVICLFELLLHSYLHQGWTYLWAQLYVCVCVP